MALQNCRTQVFNDNLSNLGKPQTEMSNGLRKNALIFSIARLTNFFRLRGRDRRMFGQRSTSSFKPSRINSGSWSKAFLQPHTKHSGFKEEFRH